MITPFRHNGDLDEKTTRQVVEDLLRSGVHGVMCCGSTGESGALSREERKQIVEWTVSQVNRRVPVAAGTGTSSTKWTIQFTEDAREAGADAALIVTPFYSIPTEEGIYQHYRTIAEQVDMPIVPYNVPQATLVNLPPSLLVRLVEELDNIVAIKDSSGNTSQIAEMIRLVGDKISILTGNDAGLFPDLLLGCAGAIVAIGNVAPKMAVDIYNSIQKGDIRRARQVYYQLLPVANALDGEQNWAARVKEMVRLQGRPAGFVRKPYLSLRIEETELLRGALKLAKLI
jgi:4-hydroxy-tetrahydrodipicolinate synthase